MPRNSPAYTEALHTSTIEKLDHEGRGLTRIDGKVTFLAGGLPGERVTFRYEKQRPNYDEGRVEQVLSPAADRVTPACTHFDVCGGCQLQHVSATTQIQHKQNILAEHLQHFGKGLSPQTWLDPLQGQAYGYRRKARLGVRYVAKKEKVLVGFREKNPRFLADIHQCSVLTPALSAQILPLAQLVAELSIYRDIPQIEVTAADNAEAFVIRHLQPFSVADWARLTEFAERQKIRIYTQAKGPDTILPLPEQANWPALCYHLPDFDLKFEFSTQDFIQVNGALNQQLVKLAETLIAPKPGERILDLFCGLGNFTLPLAKSGAWVHGVEGSEAMVRQATDNAELNGIETAHFSAADLAQPCDDEAWFNRAYDKLFLDPARSGADVILNTLSLDGIQRIVYVSCNPATLARDAGILVHQKGYQLSQAGVIDMFPNTTHVESIAVFDR